MSNKKVPKEVWLEPTERELDYFMSLPLSQGSPVSVRLPEIVHDWVKEQGVSWARNVLTKAALIEMERIGDDDDD